MNTDAPKNGSLNTEQATYGGVPVAGGGGKPAGIGRPDVASYEPEFERTRPSDPKVFYLALGGIVLSGVVLGVALFGGGAASGGARPAAAAVEPAGVYSEQAKMMREAMDMAKEAQAMQKERLELMRREMEMGDSMPERELTPSGE